MARRTDSTVDDGPDTGETRKVQFTGGSTYTVSLPKAWADRHDIEAGTEVNVVPHDDGSLVVRSAAVDDGEQTESARVRTDDHDPRDLALAARALYVAGCDTVEFIAEGAPDAGARNAIQEAVTVLVGADVVQQADDRLVVRCLLGPAQLSIPQSIVQLRHVALSMHEQATAALFDGRGEPTRIAGRDDEADRLFAMVARQFNKALADPTVVDDLSVDRETLFAYYRVARQLERVGDHAERLALIAGDVAGPIDVPPTDPDRRPADALAGPAETARTVVRDAMAPLLDEADAETAYEAARTAEATVEDLDRLDRSFHRRGVDYRLSRVVDSLVRTAEHGTNIAETTVNATAHAGDTTPTTDE